MKIGIDIDGVLWDLVTVWIKRYNEITGDNLQPDKIYEYDITKYLKNGTPEMLFYILEQNDFWDMMEAMPESKLYLNKLIEDGHEVYIVTASNYKTIHNKFKRLLELFPNIKVDQIIVTSHKQLLDLDILIDDYEQNLIGGKYIGLLYDQIYNQNFNTYDTTIHRVNSWREIYEYIKILEQVFKDKEKENE